MEKAHMECVSCGSTFELGELFRCPRDKGELKIVYDYAAIRSEGLFPDASARFSNSLQRYFHLLPLADRSRIVSLGEGSTPMFKSKRLARRFGLEELSIKAEICNPTGSFKDRQIATAMSAGNEWGRTRYATVSSGNVGIALSAHCASMGFEASVWVSDDTPAQKRQQIQIYGANVFLFPNPENNGIHYYRRFFNGLLDFCLANGIVPMISARPVNPYMVEGSKTIAFEMVQELGYVPDQVFCPVGGGGVMGGVWKGFKELQAMEVIQTLPRMAGPQQDGHITRIPDIGTPRSTPDTFIPLDGAWAWQSIQESGGDHMLVDKRDIREAQTILATEAGFFAEPGGAVSFAGLVKASREGKLRGKRVSCIVTGNGLKDAGAAGEMLADRGAYPEILVVDTLEASLGTILERRRV